MAKTVLGLDIGASSIKLAVVAGGEIQKLAVEEMPDNMIRGGQILSSEAMAQTLREILKKHGVRAKNCAVVLSSEIAFARRLNVPFMTADQLTVNLPYEFHDYIQSEKDRYFYDYAVVGEREEEEGKTLDLMAGAVLKSVIASYREMLGKSKLKLRTAVPDCFTYRNLIRSYEARHELHPSEYGIVDMGHGSIRFHIFRGPVYDTTHVIEYGGASVDAIISDHFNVDSHLASNYKTSNYKNVQELDDCMELYRRIAVELMRAVNFYGFNNQDSDLQDLYFCGGLSMISPLMDIMRETLSLNIHMATDLMPDSEGLEFGIFCPSAVGVTMQ